MIDTFNLIFGEYLSRYIISLLLLMMVNTLLGVVVNKDIFSKKILKEGIIKGITVFISVFVLMLVSRFIPEMIIVIDGFEGNILAVLDLILYGACLNYAVDGIIKLGKLITYKFKEEGINYE